MDGKHKLSSIKFLTKDQLWLFLKRHMWNAEDTPQGTGKVVKGTNMTVMRLYSIWHKGTTAIIVNSLFILALMDSNSVMVYWELDQTLHSINTMKDGLALVKVNIMTSKGTNHHSPSVRVSHVIN